MNAIYDVLLYMKGFKTPNYLKLNEDSLEFVRDSLNKEMSLPNFIEVYCEDSEEFVGIKARDISLYSYKEAE